MQMLVFKIATALLLILSSGSLFGATVELTGEMNRCSDNDVIYTVQEGDNLYNISAQFGSFLFWESVYVANADQVRNPDLIFPGQNIRIPYNVATYSEKSRALSAVLENPFCKVSELPYSQVEDQYVARYNLEFLEKRANAEREEEREAREEEKASAETFREAFDAVISSENNQEITENREGELQRESERQLMLEIDGMVHDETRSKVGRDFYDVFYTYWQSPPQANNFTIRVSEQPSPNLGTTIYVEVNNTETFRMRLQPRYEMIQEAGKYAVRQTYSHLQNNPQETMIY